MLTVKYGPFQPSLERAFLEELAELKREEPLAPVAVVAPSRRMADRLQRLVALEGASPVISVFFHTFYSLALEILREEGLSADVVRDPILFNRLLDSLLDDAPRLTERYREEMPPPHAVRARPRGLAASYRSSLKDLIDAGVEPRAMDLVREGLLAEPDQIQSLADLLGLLKRYEDRMEELDVMPSSGLIRKAAQAAPGSRALARYRALLYYGFYDLTGLQADFFEAVAKDHPVTAFFPYRKGRAAFAFVDKFFETRLHIGGNSPRALEEDAGTLALGPALDALFEPGRQAGIPRGALRVFTASGARDEAWRAAKEILRLVEEEGYRYHEIGVVARVLEPYRSAIAEAFRESGVPYHASASEPLLRRPAARLCLTLLTLARRDFPALAVLDLVESPYFKGKRDPGWRALVRRLRIHRGWLQWEGKLRGEPAALWQRLCSWRAWLTVPGRKPWSSWVEHARRLLDDSLEGRGDAAYEQALGQIARLAILDRLGEEVAWPDFVEAAEQALARAAFELPEPNAGVRVLDAMAARGESFRALFLLGLSEGLFPRAIREDPLLRDSARAALRETGGYWIATKQAGHEEEKLLFYLLAASVSQRLYCSYPRSDEEGRARIPSIYLLELCRACGVGLSDPDMAERVARQPFERLTKKDLSPFLSPKEASIAAALAGGRTPLLRRALSLSEEDCRALLARVDGLGRPGKPGPMDGLIGPSEEYARKLRARGLSPSALEMLARCPFQFYASRVLGLDEPEEPSPSGEVPPAIKGEIYHRALLSFYKELEASGYWNSPSADFPEPAFLRAEAYALGGYGWRELGVYPLLWEILRERLRVHLRRFLEWDLRELRVSGLRPLLLEAPMEGELPLRLPKELAGLRFTGIPDRVDAGADAFRVIDYKSRWRKESPVRLALSGKDFQPVVYLELAGRHPALRGLKSAGARFYALEDAPEVNGRAAVHEYEAALHEGSRKALFEGLSRLVDKVARGEFAIRPDNGEFGYCRWCSFGSACRKNHPMTVVRSRGDA